MSWWRAQAERIGPAAAAVVDELSQVNALHRLRSVQGIVRLRDRYDDARLDAACARALEVCDPSYRTVKDILAAGTEHDGASRGVRGAGAGAGVPARARRLRCRTHRLTYDLNTPTVRAIMLNTSDFCDNHSRSQPTDCSQDVGFAGMLALPRLGTGSQSTRIAEPTRCPWPCQHAAHSEYPQGCFRNLVHCGSYPQSTQLAQIKVR